MILDAKELPSVFLECFYRRCRNGTVRKKYLEILENWLGYAV